MKVRQLEMCPECHSRDFETLSAAVRPPYARDAYGQEFQFATRKCKNCGTVFSPTIGQNNGGRFNEGSIESDRDNVGFTSPNLHRRIMYCQCGEEWVCQLHKHIHHSDCPPDCNGSGHCDCSPGIVCDCGKVDAVGTGVIVYAKCTDQLEPVAGVKFAICIDCDNGSKSCAICVDAYLEPILGRYTPRRRPNESYKVGIHGHNSYAQTEVHLHHEEQTDREVP